MLELLVVVAVLGVVSGVAVLSVRTITDQAEQTACDADARALKTAVEAHAVATGSYLDEDALVAAGHLSSASSSHDVVPTSDGYSIVPTGDCAARTKEDVAVVAAPAATTSISSIASVDAVNLSTNNWRATATVQVTDDLGSPLTGAGVMLNVQRQGRTGNWSDLAGVSGATDVAGSVVLSSTEVAKYPVPKIRFRVASVNAEGLVWEMDDRWAEVTKP